MTKIRIALAALAVAAIAGSVGVSHAATTTNCDKFGSCETAPASGNVKCGTGTDVGPAGRASTINAGGAAGVQACAGKTSSLPVHGRVTLYKDAKNNVTLGIDGDDSYNTGDAQNWDRFDVRPGNSSKPVCFRRGGAGGSYWTNNGGTSHPTDDPATCGTAKN